MGATFSRVKNWTTEILTNTDLNAEIDNILNNLGPSGIDDYSTNAATMRLTTDPGESGSESLATSLAGELERLRFAIKEIKGTTYWYQTADSSISELTDAIGITFITNRISSGKQRTASSQPVFLVPSGTTTSVTLAATATNFVYYIASSQYTITADVTNTGLVAAVGTNNTCSINQSAFASQTFTKLIGEYESNIPIDGVGSEITALNGKLAGFKVGTEYFLAKVNTTDGYLEQCKRGFFFDSSSAPLDRAAFADNDGITLMKLTWIYANAAGSLAAGYTNPVVGTTQPNSPLVGDYWYDTTSNLWKYFDSSAWVTANATLIGLTLQSTSACVAARSFDFYRTYTNTNTYELELASSTVVRTRNRNAEASVYGALARSQDAYQTWDITTDLDTGITESTNTTYYIYLKENGGSVLSTVAPMDFRKDRKGLYHPHQAWLCLGHVENDASSNLTYLIDYADGTDCNYAIVPTVAAEALSLRLTASPINKFKFSANPTISKSDATYKQLPYPVTLTVPATATLGITSGTNAHIFYYLTDAPGTPLPAVSSMWRAPEIYNTTAIGTASDINGLYGFDATSISITPIARFRYNTAPNGTYASTPERSLIGTPVELRVTDYVIAVANDSFATVNADTYYDSSSVMLTIQPGIYEVGYQASIYTDYSSGTLAGSGHSIIRFDSTSTVAGTSKIYFANMLNANSAEYFTPSIHVNFTATASTTLVLSARWSRASTVSRLFVSGGGGSTGDTVMWARRTS